MKGPKGEKRTGDSMQRGITVAKIAAGEIQEELKGPTQRHKGGKARASALTPQRRSEIASKAAKSKKK